MTTIESFRTLSDVTLLHEAERLAAAARTSTATLVAAIAELDRRRLYLGLGYSSLFVYCTSRLHLTEGEACNRIEAARAIRRFPSLLSHLSAGSLSLTAIRLLAPHLTSANFDEVLRAAESKGTRAIERLVAELRPQPAVPSTVRKLPVAQRVPERSAGPGSPSRETTVAVTAVSASPETMVAAAPPEPAARRPLVKPLSADTYRLQITMSVATHDKLRKAQALMRHRVPNGDPAVIVDRALDALLRELEKAKFAAAERPRQARGSNTTHGRNIPADVQRAVWTRDEGRCAFASPDGHRCGEMNFIEFHHVRPFARGGAATVDNLELRCRAHNAYEAERDFGLFVRETPTAWARVGVARDFRRLPREIRPAGRSIRRTAAMRAVTR